MSPRQFSHHLLHPVLLHVSHLKAGLGCISLYLLSVDDYLNYTIPYLLTDIVTCGGGREGEREGEMGENVPHTHLQLV